MQEEGSNRAIFGLTVKILVSFALLVIAVYYLDWPSLYHSLSKVGPSLLILVVAILLLEFPVLGYRWHLMANAHNRLRLQDQLKVYFIATFFNNFTPGQLGSDAYRFTHHSKAGAPGRILAGLLIRERLIGLTGFLLFFLVCYAIQSLQGQMPQDAGMCLVHNAAIFIAVALVGLLVLPLFAPFLINITQRKTGKWIKLLTDVVREASKVGPPHLIALVMALTLLGAGIIWVGAVKVVAQGLGSEATFFTLGMIAILADLLRLIPITVQGVGVREAVFAFLFDAFGLPPEEGFIIGLVAYVGVSLATVLIGVIGFIMPRKEIGP